MPKSTGPIVDNIDIIWKWQEHKKRTCVKKHCFAFSRPCGCDHQWEAMQGTALRTALNQNITFCSPIYIVFPNTTRNVTLSSCIPCSRKVWISVLKPWLLLLFGMLKYLVCWNIWYAEIFGMLKYLVCWNNWYAEICIFVTFTKRFHHNTGSV